MYQCDIRPDPTPQEPQGVVWSVRVSESDKPVLRRAPSEAHVRAILERCRVSGMMRNSSNKTIGHPDYDPKEKTPPALLNTVYTESPGSTYLNPSDTWKGNTSTVNQVPQINIGESAIPNTEGTLKDHSKKLDLYASQLVDHTNQIEKLQTTIGDKLKEMNGASNTIATNVETNKRNFEIIAKSIKEQVLVMLQTESKAIKKAMYTQLQQIRISQHQQMDEMIKNNQEAIQQMIRDHEAKLAFAKEQTNP